MFRHAALFRFTPESTDAQRDELVAALRTLPSVIPEIRDYRLGFDAGVAEGNFDLAVVGDFDDVEAWRRYMADAEHQRIIAELLRPILAERVAVQYEP